MKRFFKATAIAIAVIGIASLSAQAAVPQLINYQGRLTDGGGSPENGVFSIEFTIYDAPVAGAVLWSEVQAAVTVTDGLFSVNLGTVVSISDITFSGADTYLGIKVGADPEITPRSRITSSAYSNRISTIDGSSGGTVTGDVNINANSIGNGLNVQQSGGGRAGLFQNNDVLSTSPAIQGTHIGPGAGGSFFSDGGGAGIVASASVGNAAEFSGPVLNGGDWTGIIGSDTTLRIDVSAAQLSTYGTDGLEQIRLWGGSWGEILLYDSDVTNDRTVRLSANSSNGGALELTDGDGALTINLNGAFTGDASVVVPTDAISAGEIRDEPGIANRIQGSGIALSGAADINILIRTITVPTSGFVIAFASGQVEIIHVNGGFTSGRFSIVPPGGTLFGSPKVEPMISGNAPSGTYRIPVSVTAAFSVSSGANQFRIQADETSSGTGTPTIQNSQLTLMFVPTLYGTFTSNLEPAPPIGTDTPEAELVSARQFDAQRIQDEVSAMRAKLDALQAQLDTQAEVQQ
jgi:hypothetical protein